MAREIQLPCDGEGVCMRCKVKPPLEESLSCNTCATPWHVSCLSSPPESLEATRKWLCPDCSGDVDPIPDTNIAGVGSDGAVLLARICAIEVDESLTEVEKAKKRQQLMSRKGDKEKDEDEDEEDNVGGDDGVVTTVGDNLNCSICIQLLERPVTTACGHNFCLKCFQKWIAQRKLTCAKCRSPISKKMVTDPLINYTLVSAIRLAKTPQCAVVATTRVYRPINNENRPDVAFMSERAKKNGKANACSGKIFVTTPLDHSGPITAEYDPIRNTGVLVGESWADRQECRQWGAHYIPIGGISGQSKQGAQSVALSGGYKDDEDHGEWFLYTGSGGRDLSGNKRTNKDQSSDQKFRKSNEALRLSCKMGYPVRVVRSCKEKRSAYAPKEGVRYDGVYRIEKCWRKVETKGFKICRFLFVRCDNEAAPWASDVHGDRPRPLPNIPELEKATDLFERKETPSWDFDETENRWKWIKSPPASKKLFNAEKKSRKKSTKARNKILKEFNCLICKKMLSLPVTTPCAHNFCKTCLETKFSGISQMRERSKGGRTLRAQKNVMACPCCRNDLSDFLQNPQVNRDLMEIIENLKKKEEKPVVDDASSSGESTYTEEEEEEEAMMDLFEAEPPKKKVKLCA